MRDQQFNSTAEAITAARAKGFWPLHSAVGHLVLSDGSEKLAIVREPSGSFRFVPYDPQQEITMNEQIISTVARITKAKPTDVRAAVNESSQSVKKFLVDKKRIVKEISPKQFLAKYPKPHCDVLKNITTHHPSRFKKVWEDGKSYLLVGPNAALEVVNGRAKNADMGAKAFRVEHIYELKQ